MIRLKYKNTNRTAIRVVGKNKFNKDTAKIINFYINQSGVIANNDTRSTYIKCKPNTTYTMQKYGSARFRLGTTAEIPTAGVSVSNLQQTDTDGSITITTGNNAKYLIAYIYATFDTNEKTLEEVLDTIQIEEGSQATEYEPYEEHIEYIETYVYLKIIDSYEIIKSSQEVSYNSIKCDFTGFTADDLPDKYEEVQIVNINSKGHEKTLFFGYIDSYTFDNMRESDLFTNINFTLFSPMKMATLRTFIAIGTYKLKDLIQSTILSPLINDGFEIEELEVKDSTITVNYLSETIEYGLNDLSNKFNLWWFIDENKKIHIKNIDTLLSNEPKHYYDSTHKISGLQYIKPTIASDNYANVINFANVRVYDRSLFSVSNNEITEINGLITKQISVIKKDGILEFNYPIDIKESNIIKSGDDNITQDADYYGIWMEGTYSDNSTFEAYIKYDTLTKTFTTTNNIGFDGVENATQDFLLMRDSFFSNLITGIKFNNESKNLKSITFLRSDSALIYNVYKFYNDGAVNDKKGLINNTGIVELTINMNEQWKTKSELQQIAITYMDKNSLKLDGEIELKLDKNIFKVGDLIRINKLLIDGTFIVTRIQETIGKGIEEYIVTCKNSNINDSYIDLFRTKLNQQDETKTYKINIAHYSTEGIKETFEVVQ